MKKIILNIFFLIVLIIIALFWRDIFSLGKNYFVSFNVVKNINIYEIKLNDKIDEYFSDNEIKKYNENLGLINEAFILLNIYNDNNKFTHTFDTVQFIYEIETRNIWYVSGIINVDPENCIEKRNQKFNEYKVLYNIDNDLDRLEISQEYKKDRTNEFRKVAGISYHFRDNLSIANLMCYDNREQRRVAEAKGLIKADSIGDLRYELMSNKLSKIYE